jgi:hypothetical protein
MAKTAMPADEAKGLRTSERILLLCVASGTDCRAAVHDEIVTTMMVKSLIERGAVGDLSLTDRGLAVLRAMLPDL